MVLWYGSPSKLIQYPSLLCYKLPPCKPRASCIWCADTTAHTGASVSGHRHCRRCFLVPPQRCCDRSARELLHFLTKPRYQLFSPTSISCFHKSQWLPSQDHRWRSWVGDVNYIFREAATVSKTYPGEEQPTGWKRNCHHPRASSLEADASLFCLVTVTSKLKKLCNKAGRVLRSPE